MKKNFIYLLLLCNLIAQAQITPSYPTIKLTKTVEGVKQDSLLVLGTDKIVKHIPLSKISNVQEYATASALPITGVAGKLYITKDNNKIYTWNGTFYSEFVGAKGEKGDQGVAGIVGAKGDQGIQGPQGPQGTQGLKGDPGLQGDKGDKGDQGIQGIQGFKGDTGLTGADGAMGVQGPQGIQGIQGETGLRGIQGETGPQGPIGFTGEKGADGTGVSIKGSFDNTSQLPASGTDGDAYLINGNLHVWNGTAWVNVGNIQGPQGLIGLTGATGSQGIQGVKGEKGDQGIQGIQGLKGDTGAKGDTGSFNGDITADQVTETATRKFQTPTQSAYNNATSPIQGQLNSKENAFSKNTAFNKNFGKTAGTVAEGNDSRFTDSRNPLPNSANYIQNQNTAAQSANMWIGGAGQFGSSVTASQFFKSYSSLGTITSPFYEPLAIYGLGTSNLAGIYGGNSFGSDNGTFLKLRVNSDAIANTPIDALTLNSFGQAIFINTITASGGNSTNWNTAFEWGNHAGLYPPLTGTGATGTWPISVSGNAASANDWNAYDGNQDGTNMVFGMAFNATTSKWGYSTQPQWSSWLGLGSNAYTSTIIPTNTNQLTNGSGYITDISGKVDKVTGKSLIADSEITRLATVTNQDISGKFDKTGGAISGNVNVTGDIIAKEISSKNSGDYTLPVLGVLSGQFKLLNQTGQYGLSSGVMGNGDTWIQSGRFDGSTNAYKLMLQPSGGSISIGDLSGSGDGNIVASSDGTLKRGVALGSNAYTSTVIPTNTNQLTNGSGFITDISGKVDKVAGKSLISDSEITRLATVTNQDISGKFDKTGGTISGNVNVTGTVTASGGLFNSDRRLKNIFKRDGDVAYYTWKDGRDNKTHIGYIAQEVQENHPNQVQADDKGILSVNYVEILVEKIRVLEKRIEQLEKGK